MAQLRKGAGMMREALGEDIEPRLKSLLEQHLA
jgi:hypothetical protein